MPGLSTGQAGSEPGRQRHPQLPLRGAGSPFTHPRLLMVGAVLALRLSPRPQQQEERMLPLPSSCLRLEGIHYLPGYRQLSEAIFQLCAFKELIGGEIILSRQRCWRHNFIHLSWGLLELPGDATARVSLSPPPQQGVTTPGAPCQPGGPSSSTEKGGGSLLLQTRPGGALVMPLLKVLCTPFSPTLPLLCSSPAWHSTLH